MREDYLSSTQALWDKTITLKYSSWISWESLVKNNKVNKTCPLAHHNGASVDLLHFSYCFFFYDPWGFLARWWNIKVYLFYSKRKLKKKLWYIFSSQAPIFVQTYVRLRQIWTIDNNRNNVFFKGKQIIAAKIGSDEGLMLDMSAVTTLTVANIHPQLNW